MRESDTQLVPYSLEEVRWARARPPADRVPLPQPGDEVLYRHEPWGRPVTGIVEWIEDLDDRTRPNLWEAITDPATGRIIATPDHVPVARQLVDPWPVVRVLSRYGLATTQEARLRGSAGWLPLDWQFRYRPMPELLIVTGG